MNSEAFVLDSGQFDFGSSEESTVSFLGPDADDQKTHVTLIAGANGTSKSRLLASIVEQFCEIQGKREGEAESSRRYSTTGTHGLICTGLTTRKQGRLTRLSTKTSSEGKELNGPFALPSRILVLSNLVMDKFHFPKDSEVDDRFYHYLGVRQATNLTTTGSLERAVTEAVLTIAADPKRLSSFQEWVELVFSGSRELAFQFPRLRASDLEKYLGENDKVAFVRERVQRRIGSARQLTDPQIAERIAQDITQLFEFLRDVLVRIQFLPKRNRATPDLYLRLATLSQSEIKQFSQSTRLFASAHRAGYSVWPSLCLEASPWLLFNQLSSGEQNILSTGAKLIAYAKPGCLVAIDEPEVSLNVAWQQHYTDLVRSSLAHAPGSHVLIATHSPHLISSLPTRNASVLMIEKDSGKLQFKTVDARFEGWGSETILYQLLGIHSASSHLFHQDLAEVLLHIQEGGADKTLLRKFLTKADRLDFAGIEPLQLVINEVRAYERGLS